MCLTTTVLVGRTPPDVLRGQEGDLMSKPKHVEWSGKSGDRSLDQDIAILTHYYFLPSPRPVGDMSRVLLTLGTTSVRAVGCGRTWACLSEPPDCLSEQDSVAVGAQDLIPSSSLSPEKFVMWWQRSCKKHEYLKKFIF